MDNFTSYNSLELKAKLKACFAITNAISLFHIIALNQESKEKIKFSQSVFG